LFDDREHACSGHRLVKLVEAVQDVVKAKDDVAKAEQAHETANINLAMVLADVEAFVHADMDTQARDERSRAAAHTQRTIKDIEADGAADAAAKSADENANGRAPMNGNAENGTGGFSNGGGLEDSAGPPGLHMKPFRFSIAADD
jgi:hypothetical protein